MMRMLRSVRCDGPQLWRAGETGRRRLSVGDGGDDVLLMQRRCAAIRVLVIVLALGLGGRVGGQGAAEVVSSASADDAASVAVIGAQPEAGMAPLPVQVHALDSQLAAGDVLTTRYEWDFGDPAGAHNRVIGWNAAHVYDRPGEYTVTLRVVDAARREAVARHAVRVVPDRRRRLYVASDGDDGVRGLAPEAPLRTFGRAMEVLGDGMTVLLRRGDVFDVKRTQRIAARNCVLGAYGEGAAPILHWSGASGSGAILALDRGTTADVVIQDIRFDSTGAPATQRNVVDALKLAGRNVVVRRCEFGDVTTALNCERGPIGVLSYDNRTVLESGLRAYYLWAQGSDHVHLGNVVTGSGHEHNIRLGGASRVLIARNDLTNEPKRCIWSMLGTHAYIAENTLRQGRLTVGPNHAAGDAADRFRWCVVEGNRLVDALPRFPVIEVAHGAEHVMIRTNIMETAGGSCISVNGHSAEHARTSVDIRVLHNTGVNAGRLGRFLDCGADVRGVSVLNNLYVAPRLETGTHRSAILFVLDEDLEGFDGIEGNVWPRPAAFRWV